MAIEEGLQRDVKFGRVGHQQSSSKRRSFHAVLS